MAFRRYHARSNTLFRRAAESTPLSIQEGSVRGGRFIPARGSELEELTLADYLDANDGTLPAADFRAVRGLRPGECVVVYDIAGTAFRVCRP